MTTFGGSENAKITKGTKMVAEPKTENRVSGTANSVVSATVPSKTISQRLGRRSFLRRLGWGSTAIIPMSGLLTSSDTARADHGGDNGNQNQGGRDNRGAGRQNRQELTEGDAAILRFLAAAEIIETDLWQQYKELALENPAFQAGLMALDGDMPTYVNQNTRDEFSHQNFINKYLESKGAKPVDLEPFRNLPSRAAAKALSDSGLFQDQSAGFFDALMELAEEADSAEFEG
jgi:hypothetical protein